MKVENISEPKRITNLSCRNSNSEINGRLKGYLKKISKVRKLRRLCSL